MKIARIRLRLLAGALLVGGPSMPAAAQQLVSTGSASGVRVYTSAGNDWWLDPAPANGDLYFKANGIVVSTASLLGGWGFRGVTASSLTTTITGNSQYAIQSSSGINVTAGGVVASFFSGMHTGDGSRLSGVPAASVAAGNVTAGTFGAGVLLPVGNLSGSPVATAMLPSTVAYTNATNNFTANQTHTNTSITLNGAAGNVVSASSLTTSGGVFANSVSLSATGAAGRTALDTLTGTMSGAANDYSQAQATLSGGGTVTWAGTGGKLKWTSRFIAIPVQTPNTASSGYIDIVQPTVNIPAGQVYNSVARTADANGVILNSWEALYAVHAVGGAPSAVTFYIVHYTVGFNAPSNWILVASINGDDGTAKLGTGVTLKAGGTYAAGADAQFVLDAGDTMTGALTMSGASANIVAGASVTTSGGVFASRLDLTPANPSIVSGGSYISIPNGLYISGSAVPLYSEANIRPRNGISNDTGAALTISGGTSGQTNFTGAGANTFTGTVVANAPIIAGASTARVFRDVASYVNNTSNVTGAIVFQTTLPMANNIMATFRITGYTYDGNSPFELIIGAYLYSVGPAFYNYGFINTGTLRPSVTLAVNGGNCAIILGGTGSVWQYPKFLVTEVMESYGTLSDSHASGWSSSLQTSLAAYTVQTAVPDVSKTSVSTYAP